METTRQVARAVDVESHGVDGSQYFRGAGSEGYDDVYTGCGRSEREALEDALESIASAGSWEYSPEAPEPNPLEYSDRDEVSEIEEEARRDAIGREPETFYRVALFPYNGCGPIVLRDRLESLEEARSVALTILGRRRAAGMDVSEIKAFESWDVQHPGSGVGDDEGTLSVEEAPESIGARRDWEKRSERYDDEPSDLYYYVSVRLAAESRD